MYARKNLLKEKLSKGEIVTGMEIWLRDPRIIELLGHAGFDYVHIENEHIAHNWEEVENIIRTAELVGLTPLYRCEQCFDGQVPVNEIIKALKCGAQIIKVSHVDTPEDAKKIVDAAKYPPLGRRGIATCDRSAIEIHPNEPSMPIDMMKFIQEANEETMIFVVIESPEGVKNIDKILDVDGIDAVGFGHQDYAIAVGLTSDSGGEIEKVREKILEAAQRKGKYMWWSTKQPEMVKELRKRGIQIIHMGVDVIYINRLFRNIIKESKVR